MAHTKAGGTTKKNRDSNSKRLGVKLFGGQAVNIGEIIIRQKGNKYHAGVGVKQGNDYTLYAGITGKVEFKTRLGKRVVTVV